jgi:RNA polymerase sigma-70 factor, ECF subfamily
MGELTRIIQAASEGDGGAAQQLWTTVYDELHKLARGQLAREGGRNQLDTTSIVHEAYFRLMGDEPVAWQNRRHFFGAAARAMRQIRIDHARKRRRLKRGGGHSPGPLNYDPPAFDDDPAELLALDEALRTLEKTAPVQAEVVMLRYFAGLDVSETAAALELSPRTINNYWRIARAWLHRELSNSDTWVD